METWLPQVGEKVWYYVENSTHTQVLSQGVGKVTMLGRSRSTAGKVRVMTKSGNLWLSQENLLRVYSCGCC